MSRQHGILGTTTVKCTKVYDACHDSLYHALRPFFNSKSYDRNWYSLTKSTMHNSKYQWRRQYFCWSAKSLFFPPLPLRLSDLTWLQPSSIRGLVTLRSNCCHPVLSSVLQSISSMFIVVHDVRFPIHDVLGFSLRLPPGMVPWIRAFSRQSRAP